MIQITRGTMSEKVLVLMLIGFVVFVYFTMGLFVMPPSKICPEGATILYWRCGTNLPFIFSFGNPFDKGEGGIVVVLPTHIKQGKKLKIIALPYSKTLYSISTKVIFH